MFSIQSTNYNNSIQPTPAPYIKIYESDSLGSLSVFISSILLSAGGFFAICFSWINKSRCKSIKCGSLVCEREITTV